MTPFHMVLAAPAKAALGRYFNVTAFLAANVAIDLPIVYGALTVGDVAHTPERLHTFLFAALIALMLWALCFRSWAGMVGAASGTLSHILLDGLIYPEMHLFGTPLAGQNGMLELSCVVLGALGGLLLHLRAPGWWRQTGFKEIAAALYAEVRWMSPLTAPLGLLILAGLLLQVLANPVAG